MWMGATLGADEGEDAVDGGVRHEVHDARQEQRHAYARGSQVVVSKEGRAAVSESKWYPELHG